MQYSKLTDKQKLDIIDRKIQKIYDIISVVNDALEYRISEDKTVFSDCFEFLKNLELEVKYMAKLF